MLSRWDGNVGLRVRDVCKAHHFLVLATCLVGASVQPPVLEPARTLTCDIPINRGKPYST